MDAAAVTVVTGAVDFGTIIVGIAAIAAAVALVVIAWKGAKFLIRAINM